MSSYVTANPSTGEIEREFPTLSDVQVDDVLTRAQAAYRDWRDTPVADRVAALRAIAQAYRDRAAELGALIGREMGKPAREAAGELMLTSMIYDYYAGNADDLLAARGLDGRKVAEGLDAREEAEGTDGQEAADGTAQPDSIVTLAPIGAILGIMPWNFPYYQVARIAAPNLLLGNVIVLKHAPICAASALAMEEIARAALPVPDAYQNVFVTNEQAAGMIADRRIAGVSLTGSERAGTAVAQVAAASLKKSLLELGGSDAFIVLDTDDPRGLGGAAAKMRMMNAGQACNSPKRLIVARDYYDDFVAGLVDAVEGIAVGPADDPGTRMGPLSSIEARDRVVAQVAGAVAQGATLHTGGQALDRPGAYMAPAVLTGITPEMDVYREEVFGPVAMVYAVDSAAEAVELANDVDFGLSGSVWSSDVRRAQDVADRLDVGMAMVNEHGTSLPELPFGGVKRSGYGRELGPWGLHEFANLRLRRTAASR